LDISIYNLTGQLVHAEKVHNTELLAEKTFELYHLPAGTYVVTIKNERTISQKKLIIN
jgi:hypothetical protein